MRVVDDSNDSDDGGLVEGPPVVDEVDAAATRAALRRRMFGVVEDAVRLGRFELLRRIGAGTSGIVYEAIDCESRQRVAIKRLAYHDIELAVRLKREFRTLAEIAHPNLVELYELFADESETHFSMELVEGRPLDRSICTTGTDMDFAAVRSAFAQLTSALAHVHAAGRLHLDVKPSNVLVRGDGRVALLDFGLSCSHHGDPLHETGHARGGTPLYMAPEQLDGDLVGPPTDWFAFGSLLYEVLAGRPPFEAGDIAALRRAKRAGGPPPLSGDVPEDLARLAIALLAPPPFDRPDAAAITAALGIGTEVVGPDESGIFVGRRDELHSLHAALADARAGRITLAHVIGGSGMGKSALLRCFARQARVGDDAIVLSGRCHQLESVPFRGLDGVVDELSTVLSRMPDSRVGELLPRDVASIVALFPALERVSAIAAAPRPITRAPDPPELRGRAFAGLRELLARLADRRRLVVLVDDWQWADRDALELAHALIAPPEQPAVLFVLASRGATDLDEDLVVHRSHRVEVGPLPAHEARDLVQRLATDRDESRVQEVVRESDGCPLFLVELARGRSADLSLASHVHTRLDSLSDAARTTLRLLALMGQPVPTVVALEAANVASENARKVIAELRRARLVSTASAADRLETTHDRIREIVAASCDAATSQALHRRLASVLGRGAGADHAAAAHHFQAAGDSRRAAEHAERAAMRATEGLAFEHAAYWYRAALQWGNRDGAHVQAIYERLGDVLADAGRGCEAADAFIAAAALAPKGVAFELRRRAAQELLRAGHIDRGRALLREVLREVDLDLPAHPIAMTVIERLRLWPMRSRNRARDAADLPPRVLARIDACWSAATGLGFVDLATAAAFFAFGTRLALQAGEPTRVARWLALHAIQVSMPGRTAERRARAVLERARDAIGDEPGALGLLRWAEGQCAHSVGAWKLSLAACDEAVNLLQRTDRSAWWERTGAQIIGESALYWLGRLPELRERVELAVASAEQRGDRFAAVTRRVGGLSAIGRLAEDDPDRAARECDDALAEWSGTGLDVQRWYALQSRVQFELYRGEATRLWRHCESQWPQLEGSHLLRHQSLRVTSHWRRGLAALGAAREQPSLLALVATILRKLWREHVPWADALAAMLAAGRARQLRNDDEAAVQLRSAIDSSETTDMKLLATISRRRLGALVGGDEGRKLVTDADYELRRLGVRAPATFCEPFLPWG